MFLAAQRPLLAAAALVLPIVVRGTASSQPFLMVREVPQAEGFLEPDVDLFDAPRAVLVVPIRETLPSPGGVDGSSASSVVTEESMTQSDGSGHAITKTRVCKNGACEEHTGALPEGAASLKDVAMEVPSAPLMGAAFGASFDRHLRGAMQDLDKGFQDEDGLFGGMLGSNQKLPAGDHGGFQAAAFQNDAENMRAASRSHTVSSETVVKNGHRVQRTTECVDGKCTTKVVGEMPKQVEAGVQKASSELPGSVAASSEKKDVLPF